MKSSEQSFLTGTFAGLFYVVTNDSFVRSVIRLLATSTRTNLAEYWAQTWRRRRPKLGDQVEQLKRNEPLG